jgi:DNA modification methylase
VTGSAHVIQGDARNLPLPDSSVDLVVTSPPYFSLRSYRDGGEHYDGQIGSEATPAEFVDALLDVTRECMRVLKPSGSLWVNLGDKFAGAASGPQGVTGQRVGRSSANEPYKASRRARDHGVRDKSLIGLPWRYALACIDDLGLILRAEVVWDKPNCRPESVTDRVRRSHEQWFHMVMQPRYFSAVDEIREPHTGGSHLGRKDKGISPRNARIAAAGEHGLRASNTDPSLFDPRGKLPGSVWTIPTEPLIIPDHISHAVCCGGRKRAGCEDGVEHFAAFATEWPRRIIQGWSPAGVCVACGEGRRPVSEVERIDRRPSQHTAYGAGRHGIATHSLDTIPAATITGYACACPEPTAPTTPSVILDPFGGTGTTALVAKALGRYGIAVDKSADYCRLARWRTTDPGQLAKAARVEKPPAQVEGQADLLTLLDMEAT